MDRYTQVANSRNMLRLDKVQQVGNGLNATDLPKGLGRAPTMEHQLRSYGHKITGVVRKKDLLPRGQGANWNLVSIGAFDIISAEDLTSFATTS
jgi:hypothetical protein